MLLGWVIIPDIAVKAYPRSRSWSYASQASIEGPERSQFVAVDAQTQTLSLFLHVDFCRPKEILDQLIMLGDQHDAQILSTEDGMILGQYVVEKVTDTPRWTLPDGAVLACDVEISLSDPGLDNPVPRVQQRPEAYYELDDGSGEYYELDDDQADVTELDEDPAAVSPSEIARS